MRRIGIAFIKPRSFLGWIVVWRTGDKHAHSVVLTDTECYSSELPRVTKRSRKNTKYKIYDEVYWFDVPDENFDGVVAWMESKIGWSYDLLAMLGWLIGVEKIQDRAYYYCHEFCRKVLVDLGYLTHSNDLISGDSLRRELMLLTKDVEFGLRP